MEQKIKYMNRYSLMIFKTLILLLIGQSNYAQTKVEILKVSCQDVYDGYKLIIHIKQEAKDIYSDTSGYELKDFINIPDSVKLQVVAKLLEFTNDTTNCCLPVVRYDYGGIDGDNRRPLTKRYSIQIDALFMINRLCFPSLINRYSNKPVLFDKVDNSEANQNFRAIEELIQSYKVWYQHSLKQNFISPDFPFNSGRYVWLGGKS